MKGSLMDDFSHAVEQLRWLVEHDFAERHGIECSTRDGDSNHWWESPSRRKDIARLRSYIVAVRRLEEPMCDCGHTVSCHCLAANCASEPCKVCDCDDYGEWEKGLGG